MIFSSVSTQGLQNMCSILCVFNHWFFSFCWWVTHCCICYIFICQWLFHRFHNLFCLRCSRLNIRFCCWFYCDYISNIIWKMCGIFQFLFVTFIIVTKIRVTLACWSELPNIVDDLGDNISICVHVINSCALFIGWSQRVLTGSACRGNRWRMVSIVRLAR